MKPANILDITRSREFALSHRCSVCGYTAINFCSVQTIVRTGYEFSAAKAQAHAEETAAGQMDALVADVASCREKPHSLAALCPSTTMNPWAGIPEREVDSKTRSMTRIFGLTDACPICGNQEPWQKAGSSSALRSLPPESFPTIYDTAERAELDALLDLQSVLEENEAARLDADRLAAAREEQARLLAERDAAASELQDDAVQQQISALEAQKAKLEDDYKAAGFVAFKAKKEIGAKIDELKTQLDELVKQDKTKKTALSRTVRTKEFALERSSAALSPKGAKVEKCWSSSAAALRLYLAEQD